MAQCDYVLIVQIRENKIKLNKKTGVSLQTREETECFWAKTICGNLCRQNAED